jgi:hypothetical protein
MLGVVEIDWSIQGCHSSKTKLEEINPLFSLLLWLEMHNEQDNELR